MDDRDEWEDEETILDQYQEKKNRKAAKTDINKVDFLPPDAVDPNFGIGGVGGALQRMSSANEYIAKALETSPGGWMLTTINQRMDQPITCHGFQINRPPLPEAEVNIRVTDPQLIATLHHAMQGYC